MKNHNSIFVIIVLVFMMSEHGFAQRFWHGYTPNVFPPDTVVSVGGKDVIAMWFVAPATGLIDTFFWMMGDTISALDSTGYLRLHHSVIRPGRGPGYDYPLPPIRWGYWRDTTNLDSRMEAFYEYGSDTQWVSTFSNSVPSFSPWGEEIYGLGGWPVILRPGVVFTESWELMTPHVVRGEAYVISLRVNGQIHSNYPTQFAASKTTDSRSSRAWVFYQNDSGWQAIGKVNFNIWFRISSNDGLLGWKSYPKGWNLISVPKRVSDFRKTVLFPNAISYAFGYNDGYNSFDTLQIGKGYWLKFDSTRSINFDGQVTYEESTHVKAGWNVIGTPSMTLSTEYVHSYPPGNISSGFYRYNRGYAVTDMLYAGEGYWVKVAQDGKIVLSATRPAVR